MILKLITFWLFFGIFWCVSHKTPTKTEVMDGGVIFFSLIGLILYLIKMLNI